MGLYNLARVRRLAPCPHCGSLGDISLQFDYGETGLSTYALGDKVRGGSNQQSLQLRAHADRCPVCGAFDETEYILEIEEGRVRTYRLSTEDDGEVVD